MCDNVSVLLVFVTGGSSFHFGTPVGIGACTLMWSLPLR